MSSVALQVQDAVRALPRRGPTIGPVSFTAHRGECYGLVGANGAGKTTLLRLVVALDACTSGSISVMGSPVVAYRPTPAVSGMIEEPRFFSWLSAEDNLRASFPHRSLDADEVLDCLGYVGLEHVGRRRVRAFSQGMRQRLGIARVLIARPQVMVLDEPTNGLDPVGIRWLRGVIENQLADGVCVVLSSHMLHEIQAVAHHYLMLDHGAVVASGAVGDITDVDDLESLYFATLEDL